MKSLPPVIMPKGLEQEVYQKISDYFDDLLFNFIEETLNDNVVQNSKGVINALKMGRLFYDNKGLFYSKGKISSSVAKELEAMGGKWSKSAKGYRMTASLPVDVMQAIAFVNQHNREKLDRIKSYLDGLGDTTQYVQENLSFDIEVEHIGQNLNTQLARSLGSIGAIPPEMTDYQLKEIAKNYTTNLNYFINKWTGQEIIKLREKINDYIMQGYRSDAIVDEIMAEKDVSLRKAKFLARQETKLLVAEYRKNRYKQAGVSRYRWSTVIDGRERKLHRELNGKIFSWDEPPIIDEHTGERGNPSEAYNCRCIAIPVVDDDFFRS